MTKQFSELTLRNGDIVVKGALEKLQAFAEELGLSVAQEGRWMVDRNGKYLNLKVQFVVGGEEGVEEKARNEFALWAKYYGLEASDYGAIITIGGKKYKLTKINSRRGVKYPYECDAVDGGKGIRLPEVYKHEIIAARSK